MKENPWRKKVARSTAPSPSPGLAQMRESRDPDKIREKLFAAGWKPSMAGLPVTDGKIRKLLLELNEANRQKTRRAIRRYERSR